MSFVINIVRYHQELKLEWDQFLLTCKKKHFMFNRDYMEYHQSKFSDHSLVFYNEKQKIVALLPANETGNELWSHQGLSFGGFMIDKNASCELVLSLFSSLREYMLKTGYKRLVYKCTPRTYETLPSDEELYALFINNALLFRRDCSVAIDMNEKPNYQKRRVRSIKKAIKNGLSVFEVQDLSPFWLVLEKVLEQKHDSTPVHTIDEICHLKKLFPNNIRCFVAMLDGKVMAGTLIYESDHVAHCQYLASSEEGRQLGALDLVLDHIINNEFKNSRYFDFGISNEQQGRYLNTGLIAQKEGFGARTIVHDFYEFTV